MSYSGKFKDKNNNLHPVTSVLYGTCDTAAATAAKVVTCSDFDALMTGVTIRVKFANANTAESPTVNINSTGAKSVYRFGSTAPVDGNSWNAGEVVELLYDGTSFFMTGADDIAAKQDATDNNLETEAKTIVGAINENASDVSTLKSGFTTLDNEVNGDAVAYPYADVITIPDAIPANVADCSVKIEPVQDLHGYANPWVAGAGKNKLGLKLTDIKSLNTDGTWNDNVYTISGVSYTFYVDDNDYVLKIIANRTSAAENDSVIKLATSLSYTSDVIVNGVPQGGGNSSFFIFVGGVGYDWGTGEPVSANTTISHLSIYVKSGYSATNITFYPMIRLATETDSTFAPYTNICPITGHTEASVQRDGVNILNLNSADVTLLKRDGTVSIVNDNALSLTALPNASNVVNIVMPCKHNTDYAIRFESSTVSAFGIKFYESIPGSWENLSNGNITGNSGNNNYLLLCFRTNSNTVLNVSNIQVEYGTRPTTYVPYAGKTYTVALGDTIYGGTVDFDSGVMTVTHGFAEFDGSVDENWAGNESWASSCFSLSNALPSAVSIPNYTTIADIICNSAEIKTPAGLADKNTLTYGVGQGDGLRLFVNVSADIDTSTKLKTYLSENPLQVVYPIATPTTIQLTPQQIQLLKGTNTLTASTGDISVTVNGVSGAIGSVQEQVNATDAALAEIAEQLPTAPTTDGAYVLTVTVADGTPTYSWESAT